MLSSVVKDEERRDLRATLGRPWLSGLRFRIRDPFQANSDSRGRAYGAKFAWTIIGVALSVTAHVAALPHPGTPQSRSAPLEAVKT